MTYIAVGAGHYTSNAPEELQNERLCTASVLNLNVESGEPKWYFQAIPNVFWDWDVHRRGRRPRADTGLLLDRGEGRIASAVLSGASF